MVFIDEDDLELVGEVGEGVASEPIEDFLFEHGKIDHEPIAQGSFVAGDRVTDELDGLLFGGGGAAGKEGGPIDLVLEAAIPDFLEEFDFFSGAPLPSGALDVEEELVEVAIEVAALGEESFAEEEGFGDEVIDEDGGLGAGGAEVAEDAFAEAIDRSGEDLVDVGVLELGKGFGSEGGVLLEGGEELEAPAEEARSQFGGGFVGEGGGEDGVGGDAIDEDEFEDTDGEAGGFASAGSRDDEEGGFGWGVDRALLFGVGTMADARVGAVELVEGDDACFSSNG